MKKISIVIPAYNEYNNLLAVAEALRPLIDNKLTKDHYEWEVVIVNDGSKDDTESRLAELRNQDSRIHYISLSRNFGKENAMLAGLDYASGDAVLIMDADLQDPIDVVPQMIEEWENGYDDVFGRRTHRGKESMMRKLLTGLYYRFLQKVADIDILPNVGDFRLLDRKCVNALCSLRETQRYSKGLFCYIGFSKKEIKFERQNRIQGVSKFDYVKLFKLATEGITSFTTAPLRIASVIGVITAFISAIYLVIIVFKTLIFGEPVAGFPTIMCVMLFLGGCQLICLGIIGEYIARIFNETKHRRVYIAKSINGKDIDDQVIGKNCVRNSQ